MLNYTTIRVIMQVYMYVDIFMAAQAFKYSYGPVIQCFLQKKQNWNELSAIYINDMKK